MKQKTWKVLAIVFMSICLLQTLLITWAWTSGNEIINNEIECANVICFNDDYDSFFYEASTDICYCYRYGEIVHSQVMD